MRGNHNIFRRYQKKAKIVHKSRQIRKKPKKPKEFTKQVNDFDRYFQKIVQEKLSSGKKEKEIEIVVNKEEDLVEKAYAVIK